MTRVAIVGAGIMGLTCAYQLRQRGYEVTLVDANEPGHGSSDGNTGWIVPALSSPIPAPGLVLQSIKWMLNSESPLYIDPTSLPRLAPFLWKFRSYCNEADYTHGRAAVAKLNRTTMQAFDNLLESGLAFEMHNRGLTFVAKDRHYLDAIEHDVGAISAYGFERGQRLGPSQIRELEPQLSDDVSGGFYVSDQRHIRPESLINALRGYCENNEITIRGSVRVKGVRATHQKIEAVDSNVGEIEADQFVICAGAESGRVARAFGYRIPIQAGTGYSITFPSEVFGLESPLYLCDAKVACSPFTGTTRLAGTMELSGIGQPLDMKRCLAINRAARTFFPYLPEDALQNQWSGMRPITPDGLPIIGRLPAHENVIISAGHGMLGVTLAPVTADAVAELVSTGTANEDLSAFDPSRFL